MSSSKCLLILLTILALATVTLAEELHPLGCIPDKVLPSWMTVSPPIEAIAGIDDAVDHSPHFPPMGNQGGQGSCTAWGTTYNFKSFQEYQEHQWDMTDPMHWFSPAFTYNQINGGSDQGSGPADAMKLICDLGATPYPYMPYTDANCINFPSEEAFYNAIPFRGQQAYAINMQNDLQSLKNLLMNGSVATMAFAVCSNFDNISNFGNIYTLAEITGGIRGWHCTCICGFDDNMVTADGVGAFKVANSWGASWGAAGYYWVSYQFMQNGTYCDPYADYCTDRIGYQPTVVGIVHIDHGDRYPILHRYGVGDPAAPLWVRQTYDWGWFSTARPYPASNFIVDLTDGVSQMNPFVQNNVFMEVRDRRGNGIEGSITDFAVANLTWPAYAVSGSTPVPIPDNGTYVNATLQITQGGNTPVNGVVSGTWTQASSPYYVMGDVTVPAGGSLTIDPGTQIIFFDNYKLTVASGATLHAVGTETNPITMAPLISAVGWKGIRFEAASSQTRLEYCHLQSGRAEGSGMDGYGGAVFCSGSNPTITHCTIESNSAVRGGAIACVNAQPQIVQNSFQNNSADELGGVIYCENSNATITDNVFIANHATNGGAVYTYQSSAVVQNNSFSDNYVSGNGGAIGIMSGSPQIRLNNLSDNSAVHGGAIGCESSDALIDQNTIESNSATQGGGIYWKQGNVTVTGNEVRDNEASSGGGIYTSQSQGTIDGNMVLSNNASNGGGIYLWQSQTDVRNNYIQSNVAIGFAGGVYVLVGDVALENNIISANNANNGAGIFLTGATISCENNTIVYNLAAANGGALSCAYSSTATLLNSILYGNSPNQIYKESSSNCTAAYCDVQGGYNGSGNIGINPYFVSSTDLHLQAYSACIGSAVVSMEIGGSIYSAPLVDIDGNPRPNPVGSEPDMGACENVAGSPAGVIPGETPQNVPRQFALYPNNPNPFNPTTAIRFDLPRNALVKLQIFDISGRLVSSLVDGQVTAGAHEVTFDASRLASGLYFYRIQAGEFTAVNKMVLMK
ncbi:MAG: T9SS type A sorting domain-containing protein [bacterium]|nr:T9SS type A sorting domain-containing protein [bacterium]